MNITIQQIEHRFYIDGSSKWELILNDDYRLKVPGAQAKQIIIRFGLAKQPPLINASVKSSTKITIYN